MASLAVLIPNLLLRAGLAALLSTMGFEPVVEAADLEELKRCANDVRRPDLLLIRLPQRDEGLADLIQKAKAWAPHAKVVFLAPALNLPTLSACFAAGTAGYLLEGISPDGLLYSLRLVCAGEHVFPSQLANALSVPRLSGPIKTKDELHELRPTHRDSEVLRFIARGESNRSIAAKLGISGAEVRADIKHILRKLRVSNRTQAALWGAARGLAAPYAVGIQVEQNENAEDTHMNLKASPPSQLH